MSVWVLVCICPFTFLFVVAFDSMFMWKFWFQEVVSEPVACYLETYIYLYILNVFAHVWTCWRCHISEWRKVQFDACMISSYFYLRVIHIDKVMLKADFLAFKIKLLLYFFANCCPGSTYLGMHFYCRKLASILLISRL